MAGLLGVVGGAMAGAGQGWMQDALAMRQQRLEDLRYARDQQSRREDRAFQMEREDIGYKREVARDDTRYARENEQADKAHARAIEINKLDFAQQQTMEALRNSNDLTRAEVEHKFRAAEAEALRNHEKDSAYLEHLRRLREDALKRQRDRADDEVRRKRDLADDTVTRERDRGDTMFERGLDREDAATERRENRTDKATERFQTRVDAAIERGMDREDEAIRRGLDQRDDAVRRGRDKEDDVVRRERDLADDAEKRTRDRRDDRIARSRDEAKIGEQFVGTDGYLMIRPQGDGPADYVLDKSGQKVRPPAAVNSADGAKADRDFDNAVSTNTRKDGEVETTDWGAVAEAMRTMGHGAYADLAQRRSEADTTSAASVSAQAQARREAAQRQGFFTSSTSEFPGTGGSMEAWIARRAAQLEQDPTSVPFDQEAYSGSAGSTGATPAPRGTGLNQTGEPPPRAEARTKDDTANAPQRTADAKVPMDGSGTQADPLMAKQQSDIDWFLKNAPAGTVISVDGELYTK